MVKVRVETKEAAPVSGKPWTRHYDPDVPASLVYPRVPLQAMLDRGSPPIGAVLIW
jgi:hypothetical protein